MGPKLSVFFNGNYRLMFDFTRTLITDYPDPELDNDIDGFQFSVFCYPCLGIDIENYLVSGRWGPIEAK